MNTPGLDKFLEDIERLKKGCELLERLYNLFDPYGLTTVIDKQNSAQNFEFSKDTRLASEIMNYFKFDDSE